MSAITFTRTVTFSAAHRYALAGDSREENLKTFGSLYRDEGFGHNFLVEAHFDGPVDEKTGMIANLVDVDQWLRSVAARFDHKFLNDLPDFAGRAPTLELVARAFFDGVVASMNDGSGSAAASVPDSSSVRLIQIRLYEGTQTWVDYFGV